MSAFTWRAALSTTAAILAVAVAAPAVAQTAATPPAEDAEAYLPPRIDGVSPACHH